MNASRRAIVGAASVVLFVPTAPAAAREAPPLAPGGRPWRIGWLLEGADRSAAQGAVEVFTAAMRERGWVLGVHYVLDTRRSGGDAARLAALAAELVAAAPDLLLGIETTAKAYRRHTTTIPIVLWASLDPVAAGLVKSLAHPGTNVTGIAVLADTLTAKNVEALFELVPRARRIVVLTDPAWSGMQRVLGAAQAVARDRGAELVVLPISVDAASVQGALDQLRRSRPDGLVLITTPAIAAHAAALREGIVALKLPATGLTSAGAIVRHGWSFDANLRECTEFVDRILRGSKPADLPVRQLMRVEVTLDLRMAREVGIEVPASLRLRADRVIE